jgi:hypothetical protein
MHQNKATKTDEQLTTQDGSAHDRTRTQELAMGENRTLYLKSVCISLDAIDGADDPGAVLRAMADELSALSAAADLDDVNWDHDDGHDCAFFHYSTTDEAVARELDFDEMFCGENEDPEPTPWRAAEEAEEDARVTNILSRIGVELTWWSKYVVRQAETHKRLGTKEDFKKYYVVESAPELAAAKKASESALNDARARVHEVAAKIRAEVGA